MCCDVSIVLVFTLVIYLNIIHNIYILNFEPASHLLQEKIFLLPILIVICNNRPGVCCGDCSLVLVNGSVVRCARACYLKFDVCMNLGGHILTKIKILFMELRYVIFVLFRSGYYQMTETLLYCHFA